MKIDLKKYWQWLVMLLIIVGALSFRRLYVQSSSDDAAREHKQIYDTFTTFSKMYEQKGDGLRQTPTQQDLRSGREFVNSIVRERSATITLLKSYAVYLDRYLIDGEVVYPAGSPNAGLPVEEMTFADFLSDCYLQTLAATENQLFEELKPVWQSAVMQNIYAASPSVVDVKDIMGTAKQSGDRIAAAQSRILTPSYLIPFRMDENFRGPNNKEKRWLAWRQYLIFDDLMTRAVAKTKLRMRRNVIGFERAQTDVDIFETIPTSIIPGRTFRFIQRVDDVKIELISVGGVVIPEPEFARGDNADVLRERRTAISRFRTNGLQCYDLYRVTIDLIAHLGVVDQFAKELARTDNMLYSLASLQVQRLPDSEVMGTYKMPNGAVPSPVQPTQEFLTSTAADVEKIADYGYEPPVMAKLTYYLYRPRFADSSNPTMVINFINQSNKPGNQNRR